MGSGVEVRWIKHTVQTKPLCLQEKFCSTVGYSVQVLIGLQNKAMQQMSDVEEHIMSSCWYSWDVYTVSDNFVVIEWNSEYGQKVANGAD